MSGDIVEGPFQEAAENVDKAHQQAVEELRSRVAKAKADAMKKVSS